LYEFNQASPSAPPTTVGAFDCIGGTGQDAAMNDLALDQAGNLWAVSAHNVYSVAVQGSTAHCATTVPLALGTGTTLVGLSFAPAGVLDPTKEVLAAVDTGGSLWAVNTVTGILTQHGTLGVVPANDGRGHSYANVGKTWEALDIVLLANGGNPVGYATVRDCPTPPSTVGCDTIDTLVALNMTQLGQATTQSVVSQVLGEIVKAAGCSDTATGYGSLFGVAAWSGSVLGFSRTGSIVQISEVDGTGCPLQKASALWTGAGINTQAPP
jgi:hypothetical protein